MDLLLLMFGLKYFLQCKMQLFMGMYFSVPF